MHGCVSRLARSFNLNTGRRSVASLHPAGGFFSSSVRHAHTSSHQTGARHSIFSASHLRVFFTPRPQSGSFPSPSVRGLSRSLATRSATGSMDNAWLDEGRPAVAVVTGANKGIGFFIARRLATQGLTTVLTARSEERGSEAVARLQREGVEAVEFRQLDIADADWLASSHGSWDVLVNNAGMAFKGSAFGPEEARATLATNYRGTRAVAEALLPLARASKAGARIVNVCSAAGKLRIVAPELRARLSSPSLSLAQLDALAEEFVSGIEAGDFRAKGWPETMYGVSKLLEAAYTRVLAREVQGRPEGSRIYVNACCPGWCVTDMSSNRGIKTADQGADTPTFLALLPPSKCVNGGFFADRKEEGF